VDLSFTTPPYNHNAIELHAAIAVWEGDGRLTLYDTSQFTVVTAGSIAEVFGLKQENVRVISPYVGGGFGGKGGLWPYTQFCALAARVTGRPARLAMTREGVFRIVGGRTPSQQRVAIAADASGKFTAFIHEGVTAQSTDNHFPEQFSFPPRHLYAMESYRIAQKVTVVNRVANTFMRAPGESIGTFAVESAIDALAYELGLDPIELRMRNEPERDPVSGHEFSSRYMREAYRMGAEKFGWSKRPAAAGTQHRNVSGLSHGDRRARAHPGGWNGARADVVPGNGDGNGNGADAARRRAPGAADGKSEVRIRRQYTAGRRSGGRLISECERRAGGA
jgi:xanthine dehydrogenase YagR molybdenum-binding subunit